MIIPWQPSAIWAGADAYIIGGGPSLRGFNWLALDGKNVIGVNHAAFLLGGRCQVCFFSDPSFFEKNRAALEEFAGLVVTNSPLYHRRREPRWLLTMERRSEGLFRNAIGFGGNSGCGATNLALLFGAQRVFLLGMDCQNSEDGQSHWHTAGFNHQTPAIYDKFRGGWGAIARTLPSVFPGCQVINATPGSTIECFPRATYAEAGLEQGELAHVLPHH